MLAGASISLQWVPGHKDVVGNELADTLAKEAAVLAPSSTTTSLALSAIKIKSIARNDWTERLQQYKLKAIKDNSKNYSSKFSLKIRRQLCIPRGTKRLLASTFYQLKFGHGFNNCYMQRIRKRESCRCRCGAPRQTPEHLLLRCSSYRGARRQLKEDLSNYRPTLALLLHSKQGIAATLKYLQATLVGTRLWNLGQLQDEAEELDAEEVERQEEEAEERREEEEAQ